MRNFLFLVLLAAAGYWYAHHNQGHDHAGDLAGAWTQDLVREGMRGNMILHLDADGAASLRLNYTQSGQRKTWEVSGQWQCAQDHFAFNFSLESAPPFLEAKRFGGRIVDLNERVFQFKSPTGIESWSRAR